MGRSDVVFAACLIVSLAAIGGGLSVLFSRFIDIKGGLVGASSPAGAPVADKPGRLPLPQDVHYQPPRPEDAPADIRDAVLLGYNIMRDTPRYAGEYVGDRLKCTNCHFQAGITEGHRNGGLSLVGVAAKYPIYRGRAHGDVDLMARTSSCFERSMNGRPLPAESQEMVALLTFYQWISKGVPIYEEVPWLGLKKLESPHTPNSENGRAVYAENCASCHGAQGEGRRIGPPLWGDNSYNDGAGMAKLPTIAAFVHLNMPKGNPYLSVEESLDVAAFVAAQPRPHFKAPEN